MGTFFTKHILERMLQRGVTMAAVRYVLAHPETLLRQDEIWMAEGPWRGRKLRVCFRKKSEKHALLVTTYYL